MDRVVAQVLQVIGSHLGDYAGATRWRPGELNWSWLNSRGETRHRFNCTRTDRE